MLIFHTKQFFRNLVVALSKTDKQQTVSFDYNFIDTRRLTLVSVSQRPIITVICSMIVISVQQTD